MKNKMLTSTLVLMLLALGACKEEAVDYQLLDDETLAAQIASDRNKEAINPSELPEDALSVLEIDHFDTYIETCNRVREKGYEVGLATGERTYFNLRGRRLYFLGGPAFGPCGSLHGERIALSLLRPAIVEYIQENYPDHVVLRAKRRGEQVIVLLSNQIILVFSEYGVFEASGLQWYDCLACVPAEVADIPQSVLDMIESRIPGAAIKRVCRRGERIVLGASWNGERMILVFDHEWNFLFSHP